MTISEGGLSSGSAGVSGSPWGPEVATGCRFWSARWTTKDQRKDCRRRRHRLGGRWRRAAADSRGSGVSERCRRRYRWRPPHGLPRRLSEHRAIGQFSPRARSRCSMGPLCHTGRVIAQMAGRPAILATCWTRRPTISAKRWRPLGESNPCFQRERLASWTARRRGPADHAYVKAQRCQIKASANPTRVLRHGDRELVRARRRCHGTGWVADRRHATGNARARA